MVQLSNCTSVIGEVGNPEISMAFAAPPVQVIFSQWIFLIVGGTGAGAPSLLVLYASVMRTTVRTFDIVTFRNVTFSTVPPRPGLDLISSPSHDVWLTWQSVTST